MNWIQTEPLPEHCLRCKEAECYNCDVAAQRWELTQQAALRIRRDGICRKIEDLLVELSEVEKALERFT